MKKFIILLITFLCSTQVFAFEDCVISTNGKLSDIKIQHNDIIDVFPLITIMNDKNTLIVHPLKEGESKFTVIKNNKEKYLFNVKVNKDHTEINDVQGFEILTIDCPPDLFEYDFEIDEPPVVKNNYDIDEPPTLRGE